MRALSQPARTQKALSRRALQELGALQASGHAVGGHRNVALRLFVVSRRATTALAQREFWLEFCGLDQQYRAAVRRLAQFCLERTPAARPESGRHISDGGAGARNAAVTSRRNLASVPGAGMPKSA